MKPHYDRIRKVKTGSGATAIQVGFYQGKRFVLKKHIGSSKNDTKITELKNIASEYIRFHSHQIEFNFNLQSDEILFKRGIKIQTAHLNEAYKYMDKIYQKIGFDQINKDILKHFVMIRILEPASKIKSLMLLKKYFNVEYAKTTAFRELSKLIDLKLKEETINIAIQYAKKYLNFDFSLVFYDITTLYFETNHNDDLRRCGFSKDNKINQPQILVGLLVNKIGFPIYYDIFPGNTFEGHTIIPTIIHIKSKYHIDKLTVIADAGMLSDQNLTELEKQNIKYVVGARIKNLSLDKAKIIAVKLNKADSKIIREGSLLYGYSTKRAKKDMRDNDKQIEKAKYYLSNPAKIKRGKFLSITKQKSFYLNQTLIDKHRLLEGIKGYKTNINNIDDKLLVERYKDLWRIEQAFRIAKSDLEARPIYHRKKTSIEYHILIVFVSLCMTKVIEIDKGKSIKTIMEDLKDKWTITLKDEISGNSLEVILDRKPH